MKKLKFNQNNFLKKYNFTKLLKKEISILIRSYIKREKIVPLSFESFDNDITNLVIKLSDEIDVMSYTDYKNKRKIKYYKVKTYPKLFKKKIIK